MSFPKAPNQSAVTDSNSKAHGVWSQWFDRVQLTLNASTSSGSTDNRPSKNLYVGQPYFDTDLNKPVYWNGSTWVHW
jgi:hypothetical protein